MPEPTLLREFGEALAAAPAPEPEPCPYGPAEQTPAAQYPCDGGCGCWAVAPFTCLPCWLARQTYTPRQVAQLDDDDPRRARVRTSPPG